MMFKVQVTDSVINTLMIIFIFLVHGAAVCFTVTALEETNGATSSPFIVVEPIDSREYGLYVIRKVQDYLNLTCTVFDNSTNMEARYNLSWTFPSSTSNSKNRIITQGSGNTLSLIVPHLEYRDEGEYFCHAEPWDPGHQHLFIAVMVNIKQRKKVCGEAMFTCFLSKLQNCIPQRYRCDGHQDCQMGEDEEHEVCGESPCIDKLQCEDPVSPVVRCIPKSWCCNAKVDVNCTVRQPLSCCPPSLHKPWHEDKSFYANHQTHYTDMTIIQTTIYTVIGCAMVFMMVVTVLVIAICRVHMKRSLMTQCPTSAIRPATHHNQRMPVYDLDVYLSPTPGPGPNPRCLVTYNINNGVEIRGHAIDPPPYCEVMSVPPKKGPPPPYTSRESLESPEAQALLQRSTPNDCLRPEEVSTSEREIGECRDEEHPEDC